MRSKKFLAPLALIAGLVLGGAVSALAGGINGPGPTLAAIFNLGGNYASLNVTATGVIKATNGNVMRVFVNTAGSSTPLTLNDANCNSGCSSSQTASATANVILTIPAASLSAGEVITLEAPTKYGLALSSIPSGGVYTITWN